MILPITWQNHGSGDVVQQGMKLIDDAQPRLRGTDKGSERCPNTADQCVSAIQIGLDVICSLCFTFTFLTCLRLRLV